MGLYKIKLKNKSKKNQRRLLAIFSADVVGYSRLMGEDEIGTVRTLTAYREAMTNLILAHSGRVVDAPGDNLLAELRGRHIHIWRDDDGYSVLFAEPDAALRQALGRLAAAEADCQAHLEPEVSMADGGLLFRARGPNAFLFAQLFLALESAGS